MLNRKIIPIEHEKLRKLMGLPEDIEILSLEAIHGETRLNVHIAGDTLPLSIYEIEEVRSRIGRSYEPFYISLEEVQALGGN